LRDNGKAVFEQSDAGISLVDIADMQEEADLVIKLTLE